MMQKCGCKAFPVNNRTEIEYCPLHHLWPRPPVQVRKVAGQAAPALLEALEPFTYLWRDALLDKPDLAPVYAWGDAVITVGHIRAARAAIAEARGAD